MKIEDYPLFKKDDRVKIHDDFKSMHPNIEGIGTVESFYWTGYFYRYTVSFECSVVLAYVFDDEIELANETG